MRLSEKLQFIPLIETEAYGGAGCDSDAVNVGLLNSFSAVFAFGDITGNSILTVYKGATAALAAAKGTAIAFSYRLAAADAGATLADTFGDETAVASTGLTLTAATYDHKLLVVEIDPAELAGYPFLVFSIDATANPMDCSCLGVGEPRYPANVGATTL